MSSSQKDNWRELAELLGLPADEPAPPPAASLAPPAPVIHAAKAEPTPEPTQPTEDFAAACDVEVVAVEADPAIAEFPLEDVELDAGALELDLEPADEGDKPSEEKRGRRRGRRGRRRGRDEAPENADAPRSEASAEEAPAHGDESENGNGGEDADDRGRRRRGARSENADSMDAAATAVAHQAVDQDDDFSQDAWADWNVPNWQELIDGLYRPDR
jgi:ribonuclease E